MIPTTFEEWVSCITNDCKIEFNQTFAQQRLAVYQDRNDSETQKFVELYGELHLKNILTWYKKIV